MAFGKNIGSKLEGSLEYPLILFVHVFGVILVLKLLGGQMGGVVNATRDIVTAFTTADWGDATVNSASPFVGIIVALAIMVGLVALVLRGVNYNGGGS